MGFFRSPWPIVILIVLVVLLFGANKLPGLARNMGRSMRVFKSEVEELRGDDRAEDDEDDDAPRQRPARDEDRRREDRPRRDEREYDPRDEADREPVRSREDDDSYRRD
ncbi:Sec-independent protein translocase subunit TatA [Brachybacterium sp. J144]|uniref:Sec-independent protein translocase subunit TatA n=1 Tax=unclassified Brachybacterium TaxID=2623841 RepID=UPI002E79BB4F|nr:MULTISPECIES: Sec-independent protein translocase subunit TatA [unclassified Brachybacterium]MEE1617407.1 Sec-independent protein translocase subunit TatA [Brachybacterium sp. J153]MEE1651123.1 Sec-independent protein translocase subunit TatA [Brachybacterium sp. J144]